MEKLMHMNPQELIKQEEKKCTRTTPAESYYVRNTELVLNSFYLEGC